MSPISVRSYYPFLDGTNVTKIVAVGYPCPPVRLVDRTELPYNIYDGDVLTFAVNYTDTNNGPEYIKCYIDATWNATTEMFEDELASFALMEVNATDTDYTDAKMYSGIWTAVPGTHAYAFVTSNSTEVSKLEPVGNDFDVLAALPTHGSISGRVSTGTGNDTPYIANATVVIYMTTVTPETEGNATTNVTTIDFFNTTTNTNGKYTKMLNFGEYTAYVTKNGYKDSAEYEFELTVAENEGENNFSLIPITTGRLIVTVRNETNASLNGFVVQVFFITGKSFQNKLSIGGRAFFESPTGDYIVKVRGKLFDGIDYDDWQGKTEVKLDETTELNVVMVPHPPPPPWSKVLGNVTDEMNMSLEGVEVATYNYTTIFVGNNTTALDNHTDVQWIDNDTVRIKEFYKSLMTDANGRFYIVLKEGAYNFTFARIGYRTLTRTVVVNSSETIPLSIIMQEKLPSSFVLTIGPLLDENGIPLKGVIVTFEYRGIIYTATTNEDGKAIFMDFPIDAIPTRTEISAIKGDEVYTWAEGDTPPDFEVDEERDGSMLWLWVIIAIIVVIMVAVVIYVIKLKNRDESEFMKSEDEVFEGELEVLTDDNEEENLLPNYDNRHY